TTGKPVYIIPIKRIKKKIKIFNDSLRDRGLIREFNGKLESWKYKPLKESVRVSEIICESL
ncbi:MAG: ELM1/GtrOC1 family putative glycosyltransferase, partial [Pseudomonadota bacterium]|nr:ELM1/GtrOC1 family putative glycosyltransferase [Pseudomonadota bacterium]